MSIQPFLDKFNEGVAKKDWAQVAKSVQDIIHAPLDNTRFPMAACPELLRILDNSRPSNEEFRYLAHGSMSQWLKNNPHALPASSSDEENTSDEEEPCPRKKAKAEKPVANKEKLVLQVMNKDPTAQDTFHPNKFADDKKSRLSPKREINCDQSPESENKPSEDKKEGPGEKKPKLD